MKAIKDLDNTNRAFMMLIVSRNENNNLSFSNNERQTFE